MYLINLPQLYTLYNFVLFNYKYLCVTIVYFINLKIKIAVCLVRVR